MITPATAPPPAAAVIVDFEFRADPGERPIVWCMAVREEPSGREAKFWRDDLLRMDRAPFDTGPDVAVVAYFASAEWGCFKQLGWPAPAQPIDLFAEFRVAYNRYLPNTTVEFTNMRTISLGSMLDRSEAASERSECC
jgi:hypothetical protein